MTKRKKRSKFQKLTIFMAVLMCVITLVGIAIPLVSAMQ